ncbi:adenylate/guanylate cyclase domain-containing protein [uncultured Roseibium sp.]|uniref:adenylate/guanylate cyclase domain-containing protein n=1 Tax=uncultured Roseibium sp. TaxID=1936171 RepID=UPI003216E82F
MCGWVGLVLYAVVADMGSMRVTRNYVEYLTSNSILIGAELDKTVVIITVTAILTAALYRGRKMMMASIREQTAASDLRRFFAPEVAASITGAEDRLQAGEGVVRDAAILYVDVRNFTRTANNLPPEKVMAVLAAYQEMAVAVIEREGGRVDKFLGDGILATFGAIHPSETYAADALRAAREVVVATQDKKDLFQVAGWPGDFRIGTAVAAGPVTVGVVGAHDRLEFTVIGDAVNRAAKLEDANKQEASLALTDAATWDLAVAQGYDGLPALDRFARPIGGLAVPLDLKVLA